MEPAILAIGTVFLVAVVLTELLINQHARRRVRRAMEAHAEWATSPDTEG